MSRTQEQMVADFQRDVKDHEMRVLREDGLYRHLRFAKPGTSCYHFDLITYPGGLLYRGDMGTFVFERLADMLEFFRRPEHCRYSIDMRYWAEKVQAGEKHSSGNGITEFSKEKFDAAVWEHVESFIKERLAEAKSEDEDMDDEEDKVKEKLCIEAMDALRKDVRNLVINTDNDAVRCYDAANDFIFNENDSEAWFKLYQEGESFSFTDWFEVDVEDYTHSFKWCCLALNWAVQLYDQTKAQNEKSPN